MSTTQHQLIVGPAASGKSQHAQTLARQIAGGTGGIVVIPGRQLADAYGIERAVQNEPAVLVVDQIETDDSFVWGRVARLSVQPTWTLYGRGTPDRRIVAPSLIIVCRRVPEWFCLSPAIWTVFEKPRTPVQEVAA